MRIPKFIIRRTNDLGTLEMQLVSEGRVVLWGILPFVCGSLCVLQGASSELYCSTFAWGLPRWC